MVISFFLLPGCVWFDWIYIYFLEYLFLKMFLSLRDVMTWTLFHFPVSCWLNIAFRICWTVVGYFIPIMRIQTLVLFLAGKELFHGIYIFTRRYMTCYDVHSIVQRYSCEVLAWVVFFGIFLPSYPLRSHLKYWQKYSGSSMKFFGS